MAPLTWKNVDAPSFSGVVDAQRLAAQNFNAGFDTLSKLLGDIGTKKTDTDSAQLAFDLQKYNTREEYQAAVDSGALNPAGKSYSPDALKLLSGYRDSLQQNELVDTNIAGNNIGNAGKVISNNTGQFNLDQGKALAGRQDAERAAQPAATQVMTQAQLLLSSADPDQRAKGQALLADNSELLRQSGTDPVAALSKVGGIYKQGVEDQNFVTATEDAQTARDIQKNAERRVESLRGSVDEADAMKKIKAMGLSVPELNATIDYLGKNKDAIFTPPNPNDVYLDSITGSNASKTIQYDNQSAKRNQPLNGNMTNLLQSSLAPLGVTAKVISGGQATKEEAARGEGTRTNSNTTNHDHGGAGDVDLFAPDGHKLSWERAADVPLLTEVARRIKANGGGMAAGPGYMGNDGSRNHIGLRPNTWGASEHFDSAYGPLKEVFDGTPGGKSYGNPPVGVTTDGTNKAKSVSTEQAITIKDSNGDFVNIPTLIDGQPVSNEEATNYYEDGQNPAVGRFKTQQEAEVANQERSTEIDRMINEAANGKTADNTLLPLGGPAQGFTGGSQTVSPETVVQQTADTGAADTRSDLTVLQQAGKPNDVLSGDASLALTEIANRAKTDKLSNTTGYLDEAIAGSLNANTSKNQVISDLKAQGGVLASIPDSALVDAIDKIREATGTNYATAGVLAADSITNKDVSNFLLPRSWEGDDFGYGDGSTGYVPRIDIKKAIEKLQGSPDEEGFNQRRANKGIDVEGIQARLARQAAGDALTPALGQYQGLIDAAQQRLNTVKLAAASGNAEAIARLPQAEKEFAAQIQKITEDIARAKKTGVASQYGDAAAPLVK